MFRKSAVLHPRSRYPPRRILSQSGISLPIPASPTAIHAAQSTTPPRRHLRHIIVRSGPCFLCTAPNTRTAGNIGSETSFGRGRRNQVNWDRVKWSGCACLSSTLHRDRDREKEKENLPQTASGWLAGWQAVGKRGLTGSGIITLHYISIDKDMEGPSEQAYALLMAGVSCWSPAKKAFHPDPNSEFRFLLCATNVVSLVQLPRWRDTIDACYAPL